MPEQAFLRDISLVLLAALLGGAIAHWARQPLFLGYVIAGLLVGPFTPGPVVREIATLELFAQVGVILLMFSIGIEFSLRELSRVGPPAVLGAPVAIVGLIALVTGAGSALGLGWMESMVVGMLLANSSTMVVSKLFIERGEVHTPHARLTIGMTLTEDLLTVVVIVLLPVLAAGAAARPESVAIALAQAAAVLIPFFYLANRAVPWLMAGVARRGSAELLVMAAIAIGVGTAALANSLGLSLALGAFLGGLIISESEFTHEVLARMLPMRDIFGALFFVSVGMLINPGLLAADPRLFLAVLAVILPGKFILRSAVLLGFRMSRVVTAQVSFYLAQTGEFTFVLAQVARGLGLISGPVYQAILAGSLTSILIVGLLSRRVHRWAEDPGAPGPVLPVPAAADLPPGHVLICGFGRVGATVGEALEAFGTPFTVVDLDFTVIEVLRERGVACVYGDAASEPVLRRAGAQTARLAIVTVPDFELARIAVRRLRALNPDVPILVRAGHASQRTQLLDAGATEVIQPEFEAAQTLLRHGLDQIGIPHPAVKLYMEQQRAAEAEAAAVEPHAREVPLLSTRAVQIGPGVFSGQTLRRARIRERTGVTVLVVRRPDGERIANPPPDTVLREGDEVVLLGLPDQLARFVALNGDTAS
jgi:CPA2 family monovalent cation:H+ antiporter-2